MTAGGGAAAGAGLDTIEQGKLKVAVQSYAPYTTMRGNRIEGLDGDIIHAVADKLGLEVQPQLTDFNGMLGGVQSHRVDITVGGVAWSEERQKEGLFTDPPYYSPPAMGVHSGETLLDRRRPRGPAARHGDRLRLGQLDQGGPRRRARRLPERQRRVRRPRLRPARRRLPRPAADHQPAEGAARPEDRDAVPRAADRRSGQGAPGVRVLPALHDRVLPAQGGAEARGGDLEARSAPCTRTARWRS